MQTFSDEFEFVGSEIRVQIGEAVSLLLGEFIAYTVRFAILSTTKGSNSTKLRNSHRIVKLTGDLPKLTVKFANFTRVARPDFDMLAASVKRGRTTR